MRPCPVFVRLSGLLALGRTEPNPQPVGHIQCLFADRLLGYVEALGHAGHGLRGPVQHDRQHRLVQRVGHLLHGRMLRGLGHKVVDYQHRVSHPAGRDRDGRKCLFNQIPQAVDPHADVRLPGRQALDQLLIHHTPPLS